MTDDLTVIINFAYRKGNINNTKLVKISQKDKKPSRFLADTAESVEQTKLKKTILFANNHIFGRDSTLK